MSKTIDRSDLGYLSQEDLEYLRVRGQLSPAEEAQYLSDSVVTAPKGIPLEERTYTGDEGPEQDEERMARLAAADAAGINLGGTPAAPGAPVNVHGAVPQASDRLGPDDYDDASKKELQAELKARGLGYPASANKGELIELLEDNDEEGS